MSKTEESQKNDIFSTKTINDQDHQELTDRPLKAPPQSQTELSEGRFEETGEGRAQGHQGGSPNLKNEDCGVQSTIGVSHASSGLSSKQGLSILQGWIIIALLVVLLASIGLLAVRVEKKTTRQDSASVVLLLALKPPLMPRRHLKMLNPVVLTKN